MYREVEEIIAIQTIDRENGVHIIIIIEVIEVMLNVCFAKVLI